MVKVAENYFEFSLKAIIERKINPDIPKLDIKNSDARFMFTTKSFIIYHFN